MHLDLRDLHILGKGTYQRIVTGQQCPGLGRLGILTCGLSLCDADFASCESRPEGALAVFALAGSGEVLVESAWQRLPVGSCYFAPSRLRRAYRARARDWHIGWIAWMPGAEVMGMPAMPISRPAQPEAIAEVIRLLWRERVGRDDEIAVVHLLALLGLQVERLLGGASPADRQHRLWQEVDAELAVDWTLERLAGAVGVGPEQLRRLCRATYGQSPGQRLRELRLVRAVALLESTRMSIAAVGRAVGYTDPEAFATAFSRRHGSSPAAWRRRRP